VPRIRYIGFTTRGNKGPLTTTGDLYACKLRTNFDTIINRQQPSKNLCHHHQRCAMPNVTACCKSEHIPELLIHGDITLKPHTRSSIPHSNISSSEHSHLAPLKTTDPDHSAWGPRLTYHFTLLCQRLIYLKPLREHHVHPAITENTATPCAPTQGLQHP
jgi:hypothetical protein